MNGMQLYGLSRILTTLKMGRHAGLKGLSLKQKLALNHVFSQSKLTRLNDRIYSNTFTPYYPSAAYDRFVDGLRSIIRGRPWPVVTNFAVTARCPCNCWHCSFADRSLRDKLTLADMRSAIARVQELGTSVIGLTGGEPLLRDDLTDIIAAIDERSMSLLFTTGFELTRQRVKDFKAAGLGIPVISLDHYDPDIHDRGRNRKGMHATALKAIELFQKEGFYVAVSFVPDRKLMNEPDEVYRVIEFFKSLGINDMRLTSPILAGKLTAHPELLLSKKHVKTILEVQRFCTRTPGYPGVFAYDFFESEHFYGCGAGYNYMFIDSLGNVCPCDFTMLSLGNMRERPLADIWEETSRAFSKPGCTCYANRIAATIHEKHPDRFPLNRRDSLDILHTCPPDDDEKKPWMYKKLEKPI